MNRGDIVCQLKSQSTWRLFFLSVITLGVYPAHYLKRQTTIINQHLDSERQISEGYVNFILILSYVILILNVPYVLTEEGQTVVLTEEGAPVEAIINLLDWAWFFFVVNWVFMAINRMNMLLASTKFVGLLAFLFSFLYFNYKINDLNKDVAEQGAALDGWKDKEIAEDKQDETDKLNKESKDKEDNKE